MRTQVGVTRIRIHIHTIVLRVVVGEWFTAHLHIAAKEDDQSDLMSALRTIIIHLNVAMMFKIIGTHAKL